MKHDLYLLKQKYPPAYRQVASAVNASDKALDHCDRRAADMMGTDPIMEADEVWVEAYGRGPLQDIYFGGCYVLVNDVMYSAIADSRMDDYLRVIPAHIHDKRGAVLAEYRLCWGREQVRALDYERSEIIRYKDIGLVKDIVRYVFDPERLPDVDLFWTEFTSWIATRPLVERLALLKPVGCAAVFIWSPNLAIEDLPRIKPPLGWPPGYC